jgi:hypothetical protein
MPLYASTVVDQKSQDREDRRTCRVCRQTKALSEFSLKNGRYRRVCKLCRMTRTVRQREEDRAKQIKSCSWALAREVRRGRGNSSHATGLLERLRELCGGNLDVVTEKWGEFLSEAVENRPQSPRALKALVTLFEVLRLAREAQKVPAAPPAKRRRHREKMPDFSTWTDEELQAVIDQHERRTAQKKGVSRPLRKPRFSGSANQDYGRLLAGGEGEADGRWGRRRDVSVATA